MATEEKLVYKHYNRRKYSKGCCVVVYERARFVTRAPFNSHAFSRALVAYFWRRVSENFCQGVGEEEEIFCEFLILVYFSNRNLYFYVALSRYFFGVAFLWENIERGRESAKLQLQFFLGLIHARIFFLIMPSFLLFFCQRHSSAICFLKITTMPLGNERV